MKSLSGPTYGLVMLISFMYDQDREYSNVEYLCIVPYMLIAGQRVEKQDVSCTPPPPPPPKRGGSYFLLRTIG